MLNCDGLSNVRHFNMKWGRYYGIVCGSYWMSRKQPVRYPCEIMTEQTAVTYQSLPPAVLQIYWRLETRQ